MAARPKPMTRAVLMRMTVAPAMPIQRDGTRPKTAGVERARRARARMRLGAMEARSTVYHLPHWAQWPLLT